MFSWFKKTPAPEGPDYGAVDSREKAEAAAARGELAPLRLLPELFGGDDDPRNVVFVPPFVVELKGSTDENVIAPLAQEGKVRRYVATPEYQGRSVVPTAITVKAWDPGNFTTTIAIWGEGLVRYRR